MHRASGGHLGSDILDDLGGWVASVSDMLSDGSPGSSHSYFHWVGSMVVLTLLALLVGSLHNSCLHKSWAGSRPSLDAMPVDNIENLFVLCKQVSSDVQKKALL